MFVFISARSAPIKLTNLHGGSVDSHQRIHDLDQLSGRRVWSWLDFFSNCCVVCRPGLCCLRRSVGSCGVMTISTRSGWTEVNHGMQLGVVCVELELDTVRTSHAGFAWTWYVAPCCVRFLAHFSCCNTSRCLHIPIVLRI